jgi:hypothetical protein
VFIDIRDTLLPDDSCGYASDGPVYQSGGLDGDDNLAWRSDGVMPKSWAYGLGVHDL